MFLFEKKNVKTKQTPLYDVSAVSAFPENTFFSETVCFVAAIDIKQICIA